MHGGIFVQQCTISTNSKIADNKEYILQKCFKNQNIKFHEFSSEFKMIRCVHIQKSFTITNALYSIENST